MAPTPFEDLRALLTLLSEHGVTSYEGMGHKLVLSDLPLRLKLQQEHVKAQADPASPKRQAKAHVDPEDVTELPQERIRRMAAERDSATHATKLEK